MKIAEFTEGQAEQIPAEMREHLGSGNHLRLTKIESTKLGRKGLLIEHAYARDIEMGDIVVTVWFNDAMVELSLDPTTHVEWEVHS